MDKRYAFYNQRHIDDISMEYTLSDGIIEGFLSLPDMRIELADIEAVYWRLMDDRLLPELRGLDEEDPRLKRAINISTIFTNWLEITNARVVNRPGAMGSNSSKPYQLQLIKENGFNIPDTLITNDIEEIKRFRQEHPRMIYKSISGVRSIVQEFSKDDYSRLDRLECCPVQFQEFIQGVDVRVHVIGEKVISVAAITEAVDYRYAEQYGHSLDFVNWPLDNEVSKRCVGLSAKLGLLFSGIDLKITSEGRICCLEVNPCPGFSFYEGRTPESIADALAGFLTGSNGVTA